MLNQIIICIKCGKKLGDSDLICKYCKQRYSFLTVKYFNKNHLKNVDEMYFYYLPFNLFKKTDFKKTSLKKFNNKIWIKDEGENKSKSIKEKELIVGLKTAIHLKFKTAMCISSGSGITVSNFLSHKYNFPIYTYSPKTNKKSFENQKITGKDYEDTFKKVLSLKNKKFFNITPGINPYSQEGAKVISWQLIAEKTNFDKIVIPCGNGSTLWGLYKGYREAKKNNLVNKIPELYGVELTGGPIGKSMTSEKLIKNKSYKNSKAHGIDVKESFCLQKAIFALKQTKGSMISVSEKEIENAYSILHKKGFNPNYTAASSFAASLKLHKKFPNKKICCILTASE